MIFTMCKTALLLSPLILLIYVFYVLIHVNNKASKITIIVLISVICLAVLSIAVSYVLKDTSFGKLYHAIALIFDSRTINAREHIWNNTYQLIYDNLPLSLLFGRGFGTINEMLLPMNLANDDSPLSFPTHSSYLNLFAEGGLLYLFAYLALLGYAIYISIKCLKKNPSTALAIALGLFSFVFYSLIETIHYLTYIFMFVLFTFYNCQTKQQAIKN